MKTLRSIIPIILYVLFFLAWAVLAARTQDSELEQTSSDRPVQCLPSADPRFPCLPYSEIQKLMEESSGHEVTI